MRNTESTNLNPKPSTNAFDYGISHSISNKILNDAQAIKRKDFSREDIKKLNVQTELSRRLVNIAHPQYRSLVKPRKSSMKKADEFRAEVLPKIERVLTRIFGDEEEEIHSPITNIAIRNESKLEQKMYHIAQHRQEPSSKFSYSIDHQNLSSKVSLKEKSTSMNKLNIPTKSSNYFLISRKKIESESLVSINLKSVQNYQSVRLKEFLQLDKLKKKNMIF